MRPESEPKNTVAKTDRNTRINRNTDSFTNTDANTDKDTNTVTNRYR